MFGRKIHRMKRTLLAMVLSLTVWAGDVEDGDAARARGDLAAAAEAYGRAIEADPKCTAAWHGRGLVKRRQGDRKGALADLDQAVTLEPSAAGVKNTEVIRSAEAELGALPAPK